MGINAVAPPSRNNPTSTRRPSEHRQPQSQGGNASSGQNPHRSGRTRRGSRGGQQRRHNQPHNRGSDKPKQAMHGRDYTPPYPEDIDMMLPKSENPAVVADENYKPPVKKVDDNEDNRGNR